jgi:hypothetical protein
MRAGCTLPSKRTIGIHFYGSIKKGSIIKKEKLTFDAGWGTTQVGARCRLGHDASCPNNDQPNQKERAISAACFRHNSVEGTLLAYNEPK